MPGGYIVFDEVWKRFHRGPAHDSLRDLIPALARRLKPGKREETLMEGDFWAVRDVSFEVRPGQALGIIGGNGAGKSTVLKLLTKVLTPSRGRAEVVGRAGALLEVSAGFHSDLTGRENVFLQGAIMGMPQKLIRERFDSIVEFSGVSAFIDTPVKRYSSGMNARLGFAIAVNLEPDVLLVDEVLSVGDAEFQSRAFGAIRDLVKGNIPVVIVSHQLDRVVELCDRCLLLRQGAVAFDGSAPEAVQRYLTPVQTFEAATDGDVPIQIHGFVGNPVRESPSGERTDVELRVHIADESVLDQYRLALAVFNAQSNELVYAADLLDCCGKFRGHGELLITFSLGAGLTPGLYRVATSVWHGDRMAADGPSLMLTIAAPTTFFKGTHELSLRGSVRAASPAPK